jgi:hypothetical protein
MLFKRQELDVREAGLDYVVSQQRASRDKSVDDYLLRRRVATNRGELRRSRVVRARPGALIGLVIHARSRNL